MDAFESFPEQAEAKRLLRAALADGPAHAYLFHGPPGVGKRAAALAFAAQLIGEPGAQQPLRLGLLRKGLEGVHGSPPRPPRPHGCRPR